MSEPDDKSPNGENGGGSNKNRDSMKNILLVSLLVCLACSIVVSGAAVLLKPQRMANKDMDRNRNILEAAGLHDRASGPVDLLAGFEQFEVRLADLEEKRLLSDLEVSDLGIDLRSYDQRKAARDPALSKSLGTAEDAASISRRARYSVIYLLRTESGDLDKIVLPIHGYGLWSILYGFIALKSDMNTVSGITFYEHGETAGLGGEVDNPAWKALWPGKRIYRQRGGARQVALRVIKGNALSGNPNFQYQIDGLSGATLTSSGVEKMISYWLGDQGFGPILDKLGG